MTVLMTPHVPEWAQAIALICTVVGFLFVFIGSDLKEGTGKRLVLGSVAAFVFVLVWGAAATHAAIIIDCGDHITWLDWVFWMC